MRPSVRQEDDLKELSVEETDMHLNSCIARRGPVIHHNWSHQNAWSIEERLTKLLIYSKHSI